MRLPSADELFKLFDANGDSSVSKDEFATGVKKLQEKLRDRVSPGGPGRSPGAGRPFGPPMGPPWSRDRKAGPQDGRRPRFSDMMERFDKNKDGKLSKGELPDPMWERISRADANGDAALSKEELDTFREKMKPRQDDRE